MPVPSPISSRALRALEIPGVPNAPSQLALSASRRQWKTAPHLEAMERAVLDTIYGRSASILVIEAPPRHGKSELISRFLPAWYLGLYPERRVMLAAYEAHFARSWGRKARDLLEEHGRAQFGVVVDKKRRSADDWGLRDNPGGMVTSGVGGPMTGRGADLLIVDDPIKNAEEATSERVRDKQWDWWQSTASTRIEPGGCAIVIATRWHEDDLSGRLIRASQTGDGPPVRRLCLPAVAEENDPLGRAEAVPLWLERWPLLELERQRRTVDLYWWLTLYQQRPGRQSRAMWPEDYFGDHLWADRWPDTFEASVFGIDPSNGGPRGDFSAIVFAGQCGGLYWIDASMERRPPERIVSDAIDMSLEYHPLRVGIEANVFQSLFALEFQRQCADRGITHFAVMLLNNTSNKDWRIGRLGSYLMRRQFRFRNSPGCRRLVQQLREFPLSAHDDGPDALEMAMRTLAGAGPAEPESGPGK
jgi:predicted phage terminase large subunit-like protein